MEHTYTIPSPILGVPAVSVTLSLTGKRDIIGVSEWRFTIEDPDGLSYDGRDLHSRKPADRVIVDLCAYMESYSEWERDERDDMIAWDADTADMFRLADTYSESWAYYANDTEYDAA